MASSTTIWMSSSTMLAESKVAQFIRATGDFVSEYDSIHASGLNTNELTSKINDSFDKLVTMTRADATLHIIGIIPLYEDDSPANISSLIEVCANIKHSVSLHVIGLGAGIRDIFEADNKDIDTSILQKGVDSLKNACADKKFIFSFSIVDDYAANGAHITFTLNSLSTYLAIFQIALMRNYYEILAPSLLSSHEGYNISFGLSSLKFDRDDAARQLLGMAFLSAIDKVGINEQDVDAQKAAHISEQFLTGISDRYPTLFDKSIRPLYTEQGLDQKEAVARAAKILDDDIIDLRDSILALLKSEDLTMPEKEAVLALILGRDNENIRGIQFEHEGMLLDDACNNPIDHYVKSFNQTCNQSKLLPLRGDYEVLKKYVWDSNENEFKESPENSLAMNPLPEIKRLKQDILNTTAFLREKSDEVKDLIRAGEQRENAEEIRKQWKRPEGSLADIEYKEQPLDEKYTPSANLEPKDSIDLRRFFSPIRNQMNLGSCSSFATVAMYEAMMNRYSSDGDSEMSPAFLYYHTNILTGRPSGGSNYFEQLEVLGKYGVCHECLYQYDADNPSVTPSSEAEKDALDHRVLSAKQIPLIDEQDKKSTMEYNHRLLTCALTEGFPIGISLKVYDNLGRSGAFILHPEDTPDAKEDGYHAMVIVGYSEENNFYIVRNSWGTDFGEDGYCYIPFAYLDDPDYMNFACIITETTDSIAGGAKEIPAVVANFAATETEIRVAAIRNVISKTKIELKNSQKFYAEYYKYYQRLIQQLCIPQVQKTICAEAETKQQVDYVKLVALRKQLEDSFVTKVKEHKKNIRNSILLMFLTTIIFAVIYYFWHNNTILLSTIVLCAISIISWTGYKWNVRNYRRRLQEELDDVYKSANQNIRELLEMQVKFHVAGMWLNRFHKLSNEIGNVYDKLVSFNNTLRGWQNDYTTQLSEHVQSEGEMFISLDSTPLLKQFFDDNKDIIVSKIDLMKVFSEYQLSVEDLENSHERLRKVVIDATSALMRDFNIAEYLMGRKYPYLQPINISDIIAILIAVGQPSHRNLTLNATSPTRIIITNVNHMQKAKWENSIIPHFPQQPSLLYNDDPTTLTLLTLHPIQI